MPTIRIDEEVYEWLKKQASPFEDTPNTVLRRVAGLDSTPANEEEKMTTARQVQVPQVHGEKTPQPAYRKPILSVLEKLGGSGRRMQVLNEVEKMLADRLTTFDKSDISSGGPRWQKSAEWEVSKMREEGFLKPSGQSPNGVWALTVKGKAEAAGI